VPSQPATHLLEADVDAVHEHAAHRATIAVRLQALGTRAASVREVRERLARALAVRLGSLGRVDAIDADAVSVLACVEQRQRVAVGNADDRADPFDRGRGKWPQEGREQQQSAQRRGGSGRHDGPC